MFKKKLFLNWIILKPKFGFRGEFLKKLENKDLVFTKQWFLTKQSIFSILNFQKNRQKSKRVLKIGIFFKIRILVNHFQVYWKNDPKRQIFFWTKDFYQENPLGWEIFFKIRILGQKLGFESRKKFRATTEKRNYGLIGNLN